MFRRDREAASWEEVGIPAYDGMSDADLARDGHAGYFREVFTALAEGRELPTTLRGARHNLAIVEAARRASASRRAVDVRELEGPAAG